MAEAAGSDGEEVGDTGRADFGDADLLRPLTLRDFNGEDRKER